MAADIETEQALKRYRVQRERELLSLVGEIAKLENKDPGEVMVTVTSYKGRDNRIIFGAINPAGLSDQALQNALRDAKIWRESFK